tara:strand:+ start:750 stop:1622 length:873 start_codon:yes stop_codon:yes gene_type:complete
MNRKGIILAGGSGTRLYPSTSVISKQLVPVYDKPMIYYPLSTLMLSGIKDILIISTPKDTNRFQELLGDGTRLGLNFSYEIQEQPRGLADAFLVASTFLGKDHSAMVLGDNLFYGNDLSTILKKVNNKKDRATIFCNEVKNPERYGVLTIDDSGNPISIEEKPDKPKTNLAVTGLYYYDNNVVDFAKSLSPSKRGELEITSLNQLYLDSGLLDVEILGRGFAWLDTGTHESLLEANQFVASLQERQGFKISCPEEIAWRMGLIDSKSLEDLAAGIRDTDYGAYLSNLIKE